jgi:hypothetical protein
VKPSINPRLLFALLFTLFLAARMCHLGVLWAEETLPLAAAQQMHFGCVLYRDIWFDKPPLAPLIYTMFGGAAWALRLGGALYALSCCALAFVFARDLWSEREGLWAACLLAFFLIFDFPSSSIPLATDLLVLAPHLAAVWLAWKRRPLWAGALAGVAFAANPKGLLVLVVCACWLPAWESMVTLIAGFLAVTGAVSAWMWVDGALAAYWDEVWRWGRVYAGTSFVAHPLWNGLARTLNWAGFHAAIIIAAVLAAIRVPRVGPAWWRWALWLAVSFAGVAAGLRFFPRYYFLLLPGVALLAARGFADLRGKRLALVLLLAIPLVRFAPPYVAAASGAPQRDTAMDRDSRTSGAMLRALAQPGDTLFVWGFRPEIYVYSGLRAGTRYLDSQPLTGVPADRHLTQSAPVETIQSRQRRTELSRSRPTFIVDGLGGYNPRLAVGQSEDLRGWLAQYREVARTGGCVIYRRQGP